MEGAEGHRKQIDPIVEKEKWIKTHKFCKTA